MNEKLTEIRNENEFMQNQNTEFIFYILVDISLTFSGDHVHWMDVWKQHAYTVDRNNLMDTDLNA